MLKKFLKITGIVIAGVLVLVITTVLYFFIKLPSVGSIGEALKSSSKKGTVEENAQVIENISPNSISPELNPELVGEEKNKSQSQDNTISHAFLEDLVSPQKPLSDFCASLKNAKTGKFNQKEFGDAFKQSLDVETQDPRVQAAKPMLRYVMRLPKMTEMITEAEAAVERHDESFLKKAEFYTKAVSAFSEMKNHKADIESVMDRSYLLLGLNKLVAYKPDFINEARLQNYCTNIELAFNQSSPVEFEQEKKDFLKFLTDMNVKPEDIGFDPSYKSEIDFNFTGQAMTFEGGWLSDMVKSDVELETDLKKSN